MFSATKGGSTAGYQISRSVRLRSSASAYFNRTPASASNRRTWTWSSWVKRGALAQKILFGYGVGGADRGAIEFTSSDNLFLNFFIGGTGYGVTTSAVYRDPSAWYHIVVIWDTTQATASNRIQLYINGVQVTAFSSTTYPTLNLDGIVNNNVAHGIGFYPPGTSAGTFFDGYLTEINFIDGQALTPSSFGDTNYITGVWQPKKYTGTYGTNGFYLNFSDNSGATATTIGKDYSGNGNNWTPNNISVTAGATYDSMLDVPTQWADGGNGRGNYSTMNPLDYVAAAFSGTASNGNLTVSIPAPANSNGIASTIRVVSAAQPKFYIETTITALNTICSLGMISGTNANYRLRHTADITLAVNDVVMTAFDPATGNIWYGRNGTWLSSGNPAAGTNPFYTIPSTEIVGSAYAILATNGSTGTFTTSTTFGQQPFTYTPPSGFKALNTLNLPTPTIANGANYFAATTYTGTGASRSVDNTVNNVSFQPDLVWVKGRSGATDHALYDAVRGVQLQLESNTTTAETTETTGLTAFNSNGFTVGALAQMNTNTATYVGWQWKEGATQGFDIVTYTGTGVARTVAHSLGVAPSMIIVKNRSAAGNNWPVYTSMVGNTAALFLSTNGATDTAAGYWNNTTPTSSVFTVGTSSGTNGNGNNMVAYLFAPVAGFSAMGSYTGNGSTDGPMVFTGFRPRWVMIKRTDAANDWLIIDTSRNPNNVTNLNLWANLSSAEGTADRTDILSNGFKLRNNLAEHNASGGTYIFAAFAENPLKFSLAR